MGTKQPVTKAVIAAAGYGTRFLPQTKAIPKEMLPLIDKPIIQYVVEELVEAGIRDIIIVTNHGKRSIEDHFDRPSEDLLSMLKAGGDKNRVLIEQTMEISEMANFVYVRQKEPLGNIAPLYAARHLLQGEPFIFTWSDDFIKATPSRFSQMITAYQQLQTPIVGCIDSTKDSDYTKYGFAGGEPIDDRLMKVTQIAEKPGKDNAPSNLATNGGFVLTSTALEYVAAAAENWQRGDDEIAMNHVIAQMLADNLPFSALRLADARYYDAGTPLSYLQTHIDLALDSAEFGPELTRYLQERLRQ